MDPERDGFHDIYNYSGSSVSDLDLQAGTACKVTKINVIVNHIVL